jgi:hypothetical protein
MQGDFDANSLFYFDSARTRQRRINALWTDASLKATSSQSPNLCENRELEPLGGPPGTGSLEAGKNRTQTSGFPQDFLSNHQLPLGARADAPGSGHKGSIT